MKTEIDSLTLLYISTYIRLSFIRRFRCIYCQDRRTKQIAVLT